MSEPIEQREASPRSSDSLVTRSEQPRRIRSESNFSRFGFFAAGLSAFSGAVLGAREALGGAGAASAAGVRDAVTGELITDSGFVLTSATGSAARLADDPDPRARRRARRAARRRARRRRRNGSVKHPLRQRHRPRRRNAKRPNAAGGPTDRDGSYTRAGSRRRRRALPPGRQYAGFAEAAANAKPAAPSVFSADPQAHLLRRATYAARPEDVAALKSMGINAWLSKQLSPESVADDPGGAAWSAFALAGADPAKIHRNVKQYNWDAMIETSAAVVARQVASERQLFEQVVDVFANHLHVNIPGAGWDTSPGYYVNVIRKHAFGKYRDMLIASMRHPAMLEYLDNHVSTATNLNENLGRELLELHTVGISGGYTESDVRASAKVLTGRSINFDRGVFEYRAGDHHVGPLQVLGWTSPNGTAAGGLAVGDSYLTYLAQHPSTARTIARKLAVRFVADQPSESLIDRLAAAYLANDTDIRAVLVTLFRSSDFWSSVGWKTRRPLEDLVGAARVLGVKPTKKGTSDIYWRLADMGHTPLGWAPPNGYPDVAPFWINAGAMIARWATHRALTQRWYEGFKGVDLRKKFTPKADETAGTWIDRVSVQIVGQKLQPEHRTALLQFATATEAGPAAPAHERVEHVVALLLDSAYFQLR